MNNHHLSTQPKTPYREVKFYPTRHDLCEDIRIQVVELLNQTLATTVDLKTQVKQAHWNVKGLNFYSLHTLFDEIAAQLEAYTDILAERITALGSTALGTARIAACYSDLSEYPLEAVSGQEHVTALAERVAAYAKFLRTAIDQTTDLEDADTADLYTEISRTVDKQLWLLEAHLHVELPLSGQQQIPV